MENTIMCKKKKRRKRIKNKNRIFIGPRGKTNSFVEMNKTMAKITYLNFAMTKTIR